MNTRTKLPYYLSASLIALALTMPANAAEAPQKDKKEESAKAQAEKDKKVDEPSVEEVVVTGSLIPRPTTSTDISPVTVITAEDMKIRGQQTLAEVLKASPENTGYSEGKASNLLGRFTFGAQELNYRGLGPGRTLVLVNGRRIADFPLPFGGEANGVDVASIPFRAIAKVETLSSGASAIYGSDAVGGVINIITKRDMEQTIVDAGGSMQQGGFGGYGYLSAITGNSWDRGSFTVGIDAQKFNEVRASDVSYIKKNDPFNASILDIIEYGVGGTHSNVDEDACTSLGFEYSAGSEGCTKDVTDTISLTSSEERYSGFFDGRYDLTDDIQLYATGMAMKNTVHTLSNVLFFQGIIADEDNSNATFVRRGFSSDEIGLGRFDNNSTSWTINTGAKGGFEIADDKWYWDLTYSYSRYKNKMISTNLKEEGIRNWLLDGAASATDAPDQRYTFIVDSNFYDNQLVDNITRKATSADVAGLIGENVLASNSSASTLGLTLNGQLSDFGFMYKPAKFAVRAEMAWQYTDMTPDARSLNTTGQGWYNIGVIKAHGDRKRKAMAVELNLPLLSQLEVSLASRYDNYSDASSVSGRMTNQAKFLYRANDWLKVRGGWSQTFRAPDMFNIYGQSDAFETVADYAQPGCFTNGAYVCPLFDISSSRRSDTGLREEHGKNMGVGLIITPVPDFWISADYSHITLKDLVITESAGERIFKEWRCNTGDLDNNSQLCQDLHSRIIRNGIGVIDKVIVKPINQDEIVQDGLLVSAAYSFESDALGRFDASVGYFRMLNFRLNRFAGDESINLEYGEPGASSPRSNMSATLQWYNPLTTGKAIGAGLQINRMDGVKNYYHTQLMRPMYNVNLTGQYQFTHRFGISLGLSNLLNTKPQRHGEEGVYPGFWSHLQMENALGRRFMFNMSYTFN